MTHTMTKSEDNYLLQFHDHVDKHQDYYPKYIKKNVERQKEMLNIYDYNNDVPLKICKWIEKWCILIDGENAGERVRLQLWQKWIICSIFGFYGNIKVPNYDEDGNECGVTTKYVRIVNDVLLCIGSGNSKTTMLSWIISYLLMHDVIPNCNVFIGSNTYKQSRLCFDTVVSILRANTSLESCFRFRESIGEIQEKTTNAKLRAMSSKGDNQEGIIPALVVVDESHVMRDSTYIDNLKKSVKRSDMLYIEMTTQGTVRGGHLDEKLEYSKRLLDGESEDKNYRYQPFIFEQDSEQEVVDAYRGLNSVSVLRKSNPSLGKSISVELLMDKIRQMIETPSKKSTILTKNFNIPQNPSSSYFSQRECETKEFNEDVFINAPIFLGLDMAHCRAPEDDLASLTMMLYNPYTNEAYFKDIAFIPRYFINNKTDENGNVDSVLDDMVKYKSKNDTFIAYNERLKKYGYEDYAKRGDLVVIDEKLQKEFIEIFGEQARVDLTGITEDFIIYYVAYLQMKYNFTILKFGSDPNKASKVMSYASSSIQSLDGKDPVVPFMIEKRTHSEPTILMCKDMRARQLVYDNSKLSELHFATATAHENHQGSIVFDRKGKTKKDILSSQLACISACNVFLNNRDTGEMNTNNYKTWWRENGDRIKNLQQ